MSEEKIDIREIRKRAGFSLTDMAKIFGYKNVQSWTNKENGSRKFNNVELEYFLLITGAHPEKKITYINDNYEKLNNEFIFNRILFTLGIHKNLDFIQTIFELGDLGFKPTKAQITKWRNPNRSTPLDNKTLVAFFNGMEKFNKINRDSNFQNPPFNLFNFDQDK